MGERLPREPVDSRQMGRIVPQPDSQGPRNLSDTSSGWWLLSWFGLAVAVGVDGEDPDEGITVVDVDETLEFDDADRSTCETTPHLDELAPEAEVA